MYHLTALDTDLGGDNSEYFQKLLRKTNPERNQFVLTNSVIVHRKIISCVLRLLNKKKFEICSFNISIYVSYHRTFIIYICRSLDTDTEWFKTLCRQLCKATFTENICFLQMAPFIIINLYERVYTLLILKYVNCVSNAVIHVLT